MAGRTPDLKLNDLLNLVANEVGGSSTPAMARRYLNALKKVLLEELKLNKKVYLHEFGWFEIKDYGGFDTKMGDPVNGGSVIKYIKPREHVTFRESDVLFRIVNENDYIIPKKPKKGRTKREAQIVHNERRRKPKPSMEESICELLNGKGK